MQGVVEPVEIGPKNAIPVNAAATVPKARSSAFRDEAPVAGCISIKTVIKIHVEWLPTSPGSLPSQMDAATTMRDKKLGCLPVVADGGQLVGIITELDLIVRNTRLEPPAFFALLDARIPLETPAHYQERMRHMLGTLARDVMTEKVVSIGPDEELESLAEIMVKQRVNPLPVVEDDRLVGIVSRSDIIAMMARDLDEQT